MRLRLQTAQAIGVYLLSTISTQTSSSAAFSPSNSDTQASCPANLPTPISLPIRNVTLEDGTFRRGIALSYGTPPQALAFKVPGGNNNTYIYDGAAPCDSTDTRPQCSAQFGGLFDGGSSSTFESYRNLTAPGLVPVLGSDPAASAISGTDELKVTSSLSLPNYPVGIVRVEGGSGDSRHINLLGLSINSTLLKTLKTAGNIASNAYGFFEGWVGAQTEFQMDGSVVLGGYDRAKITGSNVTLPFQYRDTCISGLIISVTDITMNLKNGSNPSILGESQGSAIQACVDPVNDYMSLDNYIWSRFVNVSGVVETGRILGPINFWTMTVLADGAYDGDITVSIYPNLQIRIPNHQLVVPEYDINPQGTSYIKNDSNSNILLLSLEDVNENDMPRFGKPFLSSAYLFVDNDHQQFSLWQSKVTMETELVAVGPHNCTDAPPITASSSTPEVPGPPTVSVSPTSSTTVRTGAIAGGVVGGVAVIGLCFGAFYMLARRRKETLKASEEQEHAAWTQAAMSESRSPYKSLEMSSDRQPPQEMPTTQDPGYSLAPYEMDAKEDDRRKLPEMTSSYEERAA